MRARRKDRIRVVTVLQVQVLVTAHDFTSSGTIIVPSSSCQDLISLVNCLLENRVAGLTGYF